MATATPSGQVAQRRRSCRRFLARGASMRAVTASNTCVTGTVRRGAFSVAATVAWMRSTLPLESLMPMMFGCWASSAMTSIGIS